MRAFHARSPHHRFHRLLILIGLLLLLLPLLLGSKNGDTPNFRVNGDTPDFRLSASRQSRPGMQECRHFSRDLRLQQTAVIHGQARFAVPSAARMSRPEHP